MFYVLRKQFNAQPLYLNDPEVPSNVDIYFVQQELDYNFYPDESYKKETRIPAR